MEEVLEGFVAFSQGGQVDFELFDLDLLGKLQVPLLQLLEFCHAIIIMLLDYY